MLTLLVGVGIVAGPLFGEFTARHPLRRSWLVITVIVATAVMWTVVLLVPPPAPGWLLVVLVVVLATGGPGSMIGFDYARTFNPAHRGGTAVGIVNVGGFTASLLTSFAVGAVLGVVSPQGYTPEAFRLAWTVQYVVWVVAIDRRAGGPAEGAPQDGRRRRDRAAAAGGAGAQARPLTATPGPVTR